jgi:hypothetical protein
MNACIHVCLLQVVDLYHAAQRISTEEEIPTLTATPIRDCQ